MKIFLKYILLPIILLIAIYCALCYFGPKQFDTDEHIDVESSPGVVYNLVNSLKKTATWNDWTLSDTTMTIEYNDIKRGVGAESNWVSADGNGTQRIVTAIKNQKITTELQFEGWDGVNTSDFILTPKGDITNVRWTFNSGSDLPFLLRGYMLVTGAKSGMKESYRKGLENIKKIAEERTQKGLYNGYTIQLKELGERNYVLSRSEIKKSAVQQYYATNLGSLFSKVQQSGVEMDGIPCAMFFKWEEGSDVTDMAAAIPMKQALSIDGASSLQIADKAAVQVDYYGDYYGAYKAHRSIEEYLLDNDLFQDPPYIEEYVTDPATEKDPSKWLTRITYFYSE